MRADSAKRLVLGIIFSLIVASPGVHGLWKGQTWLPAGHRGHSLWLVGLAGQSMAITWLAFAILAHLRISWYPQHAGSSGYRMAETSVIVVAIASLLTALSLMVEQIFKL